MLARKGKLSWVAKPRRGSSSLVLVFFCCYCIRDPFHMKSTDRGLEVGNHWPFCYCQSQDDLMRELMTCLERAFYMFRAKSFYSLAKSLRFFGGDGEEDGWEIDRIFNTSDCRIDESCENIVVDRVFWREAGRETFCLMKVPS